VSGSNVIRVGTRASALAMAQTAQIAERLAKAAKAEIELVPVTTEGDTSRASLASLGGTGVFAAALREALVDGLGIKPKFAFGPLRTAVSGRRVSPPLFESMEILGKTSTLARIHALRATL